MLDPSAAARPRCPVVLIEDDGECASGCIQTLTREGWTATWFSSATEALTAIRAGTVARLVLMDLELPGESAFEAMATLRGLAPEASLVAFTSHAGDDYLFGALRAGAVAYLLKHDTVDSLSALLEEVCAGGSPMSPGIARRVLDSFHPVAGPTVQPEPAPGSPRLSEREKEVIFLLGRGCSYTDCAGALGISVHTVRTHVRHGYEKLHACTKAEAVAEAFRHGLVR
jgi:DNA-binding NarL/FixJ family response regulator